jgi:SAM-dependent methyltransferase
MNPLDLYAKIEPLIGFYDEYEKLYLLYLQKIKSLHVKSVLDIGCGNGRFLKHLNRSGFDCLGIDRSKEMVKKACAIGVNAKVLELENIQKNSFDSITAVGDVLNYMNQDELNKFFDSILKVLKKDGYFLFDINTVEGFELTDGAMVKDFEDKFLSIEANFNGKILKTDITLFEKEEKNFVKYSANITQYYHNATKFKNIKGFKTILMSHFGMFESNSEKTLVILQKY